MALSTAERSAATALPPHHSVEQHIEAERLALAAERQAAAAQPAEDRWMLVRAAGLGLALAGTIALGWSHVRDRDQPAPPAGAEAEACPDGSDVATGAAGCR